jgi:hypothetical protein
MSLFDISWGAQKIAVEQSAIEDVKKLDRHTLLDPGLAGVLDKIASHYSLDVATLEPNAISGSRRGVERAVDDFGMTRNVTIQVMDIRIPFRGEAQSFRFSPSYCSIPSQRCDVKNDHLLITLADDANVQKNVDQFVQQISQNLDGLRNEVGSWLPQLRALLDQIASARMKEIAAQNERDKNLKFKVD